MKKALVIVLMLFVIVASSVATTYPIEYKDKYCKGEWVKHGWAWVWEEECITKNRETSVDVPETDLTPVEDRLYTLEHDGGFGYTSFMRAMHEEVLDWLKGIFTQNNDFQAYKLEQEKINVKQNARIFACEKALGMTEGY